VRGSIRLDRSICHPLPIGVPAVRVRFVRTFVVSHALGFHLATGQPDGGKHTGASTFAIKQAKPAARLKKIREKPSEQSLVLLFFKNFYFLCLVDQSIRPFCWEVFDKILPRI
jgi:hypothetical protein